MCQLGLLLEKTGRLGTLAPLTESLRSKAQPFMEDLYTALHQHVQLAVLEGTEAVIIKRLSAPQAQHLVSHVGGRLPLHCSGVGKVLLAHSGADQIDKVLSGTLHRYTPQTTTDPTVLRSELAECRRTGYATVRSELTDGADSIATRIVDGEGRACSAGAPESRSATRKIRFHHPARASRSKGLQTTLPTASERPPTAPASPPQSAARPVLTIRRQQPLSRH